MYAANFYCLFNGRRPDSDQTNSFQHSSLNRCLLFGFWLAVRLMRHVSDRRIFPVKYLVHFVVSSLGEICYSVVTVRRVSFGGLNGSNPSRNFSYIGSDKPQDKYFPVKAFSQTEISINYLQQMQLNLL